MSLLKCFECGNKVSEYANKCSNCGCPISLIKENVITRNSDTEFIYKGKHYDFSRVRENLKNQQELAAIQVAAEICKISLIEAKCIMEVIKFNKNEIPADYEEALEAFRAYNRNNRLKCPRCGSTNIQWKNKRFANGLIFKRNVCAACGNHWR